MLQLKCSLTPPCWPLQPLQRARFPRAARCACWHLACVLAYLAARPRPHPALCAPHAPRFMRPHPSASSHSHKVRKSCFMRVTVLHLLLLPLGQTFREYCEECEDMRQLVTRNPEWQDNALLPGAHLGRRWQRGGVCVGKRGAWFWVLGFGFYKGTVAAGQRSIQ